MEQGFLSNKVSLYAAYYNNIYRDQIQYYFDPITFDSQYRNINRALAHGAEVDINARLNKNIVHRELHLHVVANPERIAV